MLYPVELRKYILVGVLGIEPSIGFPDGVTVRCLTLRRHTRIKCWNLPVSTVSKEWWPYGLCHLLNLQTFWLYVDYINRFHNQLRWPTCNMVTRPYQWVSVLDLAIIATAPYGFLPSSPCRQQGAFTVCYGAVCSGGRGGIWTHGITFVSRICNPVPWTARPPVRFIRYIMYNLIRIKSQHLFWRMVRDSNPRYTFM